MATLRGWGPGSAPTASNTSFALTLPGGSNSLTTSAGAGTATPQAGDLVIVVFGLAVTTGTLTIPTATGAGTAVTTLAQTSANGLRSVIVSFTAASGDLTSTGTITFSCTSSGQWAMQSHFYSTAGAETIATPTGGTGSALTFPTQAAPAVSGDELAWFAVCKGNAASPTASWASSSPTAASVRTLAGSGTSTPMMLSTAEDASSLGTASQAGPTGVTATNTAGYAGYALAFKPATSSAPVATAGSALTGTTAGTVTGSVSATTTPAGHTVTWATRIVSTTLTNYHGGGTGSSYQATITSGNNTATPTVTLPCFAGTAVIGYTPTDTTTSTAGAEVTQSITINAQAPTVTAPSTAHTYVGTGTTLSVTATDPTGELHSLATPTLSGSSGATISSAFTSGDTGTVPGPSAAVYTVTLGAPTTAGTYTIGYSSSNLDGVAGTASTALTVANLPVANAGTYSPVDLHGTSNVTQALSSSGSSGSGTLTYLWTITSGPTVSGAIAGGFGSATGPLTSTGANPNLVMTKKKGGTYTGTLVVTDQFGTTATANWSVGAQVMCIARKIDGQICYQQVKLT